MGHDISGYLTKEMDNEVAYLRRGTFDKNNKAIYEALKCSELNGSCSGIGADKTFTINEILEAIKRLATDKENGREIIFLAECLNEMDEEIIINFS